VSETLVTRFFAVMNEHDADAVEEIFAPEAEIVIGPHVARGHDEIRELALQSGPPELEISTRPIGYSPAESGALVPFVRTQVWRESGDVAVEEELWAAFEIDEERIRRVEMHQEQP
jgi:SnoaL-like domain